VILDDPLAPKQSDQVFRPAGTSKRKADMRDNKHLGSVLSKTEVMILNFHQDGHLSQRRSQALLNMLRHPEFNVNDLQSATIVHLLRRLERPFQESAVSTYDLWKEGDGLQPDLKYLPTQLGHPVRDDLSRQGSSGHTSSKHHH